MIESRSFNLLRGLAIGLLIRLECALEVALSGLNYGLRIELFGLEHGLIGRLHRIDGLSDHTVDQVEMARRRRELEFPERTALCGKTELDRQPQLAAADQTA